jgi:hypothetical protein
LAQLCDEGPAALIDHFRMRPTAKIAGIALVAVLATAVNGTPDAAAATGVTAPGSILYVKNHDVWLTNSTASTTTRITTDGGTASTDGTGGVGYHAPTEPDSGAFVVAIRNQSYPPGYSLGWIWVLNRDGSVIRKFQPPQFTYIPNPGSPCPVPAYQVPRGLLNATVSPDGNHIGYTAWTYEELSDCTVAVGYSTYIVRTDGTGAHEVARSGGDAADLEMGRWASNTRLLLDDVDFGSVAFWSVTLPRYTAVHWSDAPDYLDAAYSQPALSSGKLASDSYSEYAAGNVLRLWTSNGPPAQPDPRCEYPTDDLARGAYAGDPSWAPRAKALAWSVDDDKTAVRTGEGLYVVKVGATLTCAPAPVLLVPGGFEPYWSPAAA